MAELITLTEFAKRLDVSKQAISKAIERGRIQKTPSGKIDYDSQSIAWEANRAVEKDHRSRGMTESKGTREKYQEAQLLSKFYESKIRELRYKELEGELISKESLQKRLLPKLTLIKSHMMTLPARHSHTLASRLIRNAEKLSKAKSFHRILAKMDEQQLARDIGEILDSDVRKLMKEIAGAEYA